MNSFTPAELRTLELVCDTLLPGSDPAWRASIYLRAAAVFEQVPNADEVRQLRQLLRWLEVPVATAVVGRRWKKFSALGRTDREAFLQALAHHPLRRFRKGFQVLKRLAMVLFYADANPQGSNPTWPDLAYPKATFPTDPVPKRIRPLSLTRDTTLDCDVVVVGSGAGGGVVAGELAAGGWDVVVIEKGGYFSEADYTPREFESFQRLYLDSGLLGNQDRGVAILAGSCLGGGTVINYTTSLRTPDAIRADWACQSGLRLFASDEFTQSLDAVCARLHVNQEHSRPSARDAIMAAGLTACGWHVGRVPRNVDRCPQDDLCGYCGLGCVRGAKMSTLKTYLQDAYKHGARFLVNCAVDRVSIRNRHAVGVTARTLQGHDVTVRARAVVAAAGAIHTPALLLRSGCNGQVGQHLRLHPATAVWGYFEQEVRPWTGTIQALYSEQFADLDAAYGVRFETAPVHPALLALSLPWTSAAAFAQRMQMLSHLSLVGILLRDRYGGRIVLNRAGLPLVHYRLSPYDQQHVRLGVQAAAEVLLAAGAREIFSSQDRVISLAAGRRTQLRAWLDRVDRVGYGTQRMGYLSAHQMGTCRMGSRAVTSVVNGSGETHEVKRLFVADASLFPSASGVNPKITISALAHYVAQQIKAQL